MDSSHKLTTLAISRENYKALKEIGRTGDSFNDVLSALLIEKAARQTSSKSGIQKW